MKHSIYLLLFAGVASALFAQGYANRQRAGAAGTTPAAAGVCPAACPATTGQPCDGACVAATNATTPIVLSEAARAALLFQIDEERMAGELYAAFAARWNLPPFVNIPRAEARHQAALTALAARAGVTVPAATPGQFATAEVQKRYNDLLAAGLESADNALRTGAFVEEVDIADLRALAAITDSADLKQIVVSLEKASGHHLGAFVRSLAARGAAYTAQVLTADEVAALTAAAPGRGGLGNGLGLGAGAGRGYRGGR